jgi:hypothetical protein
MSNFYCRKCNDKILNINFPKHSRRELYDSTAHRYSSLFCSPWLYVIKYFLIAFILLFHLQLFEIFLSDNYIVPQALKPLWDYCITVGQRFAPCWLIVLMDWPPNV